MLREVLPLGSVLGGADLLAPLAYKPVRVKCQGTWTMIFVEMPALLPRAAWSYLAASLSSVLLRRRVPLRAAVA